MYLIVNIFPYILWFAAGFISGVTSFGGNLVAVPVLTMIWLPQKAIFLGCIVGGFITCSLVFLYRKFLNKSEISALFAGVVPGTPLGVYILNYSSPQALLFCVSASLTLFLIWQFFRNRLFTGEKTVSKKLAFPCGLFCGLLQGATGMGGPPLVLYAFLRRWSQQETVANINASIAMSFAVWACMQWLLNSDLNMDVPVKECMVSFCFACLGIMASLPVLHRLNIAVFRRLLLVMVAFAALVSFIRSIIG